jgi:hypothetical protein
MFLFTTTTPSDYETPASAHPPRLQMRAGGGHSHSSDPQHPTPPSSLANASRGWVHSQSPPPHLTNESRRLVGGVPQPPSPHHHHHQVPTSPTTRWAIGPLPDDGHHHYPTAMTMTTRDPPSTSSTPSHPDDGRCVEAATAECSSSSSSRDSRRDSSRAPGMFLMYSDSPYDTIIPTASSS